MQTTPKSMRLQIGLSAAQMWASQFPDMIAAQDVAVTSHTGNNHRCGGKAMELCPGSSDVLDTAGIDDNQNFLRPGSANQYSS